MADGRAGRVVKPGARERKRERQVWRDMKARCMNPRHPSYKDYGARGITVDPSWSDFEVFFADMGPRPHGHSLERRENNHGYCKSNCMWATPAQQALNRRTNRMVTLDGVTLPFKMWSQRLGLNYRNVQSRVNRGMSHAEALTAPWRKSRLEVRNA